MAEGRRRHHYEFAVTGLLLDKLWRRCALLLIIGDLEIRPARFTHIDQEGRRSGVAINQRVLEDELAADLQQRASPAAAKRSMKPNSTITPADTSQCCVP